MRIKTLIWNILYEFMNKIQEQKSVVYPCISAVWIGQKQVRANALCSGPSCLQLDTCLPFSSPVEMLKQNRLLTLRELSTLGVEQWTGGGVDSGESLHLKKCDSCIWCLFLRKIQEQYGIPWILGKMAVIKMQVSEYLCFNHKLLLMITDVCTLVLYPSIEIKLL